MMGSGVMGSAVMPGFQVMSDLLTIREKNIVYSLIGPHCTLMKCTVAQVLQSTQEPEAVLWRNLACGVLCVIRDQSINTYFLRLFSVQRAELLWEHEVYIPFKYAAPRTYFHTFPADGHQTGFNFADGSEAEEFYFAVETVKEDLDKLSFEHSSEKNDRSSEISDIRAKPSSHTDWKTSCQTVSPTAKGALTFDHEAFLRRLLSQSRLTEEDLRRRSVSDIVDHIISQSGGAQAVRKELHRGVLGSGSKTLPRSSGSSLSQRKEPLPRTPSFPGCPTTEQSPVYGNTGSVRVKKSATFSAPAHVDGGKDAILAALTELFRQKQLVQNEKNESSYENAK
ncbi:actin nucleation-promoting factor WASL [Periophthalmus magnuspinnatus]|uniref:actin nucleation-promoting factor WASL n=1 Tax=Periophthalmus magnuspinnatus TaxID=409849 RepID=UPI0024372DA1|nr:actin nucleation-promoting factor WASL [Periophthalmus magnuspinnatus]